MDILSQLLRLRGCKFEKSHGLPVLTNGESLPADLEGFYHSCGGLILNPDSDNSRIKICSPTEFVRASPEILIGLNEAELELYRNRPSWTFFILARLSEANFITIDLGPTNFGRIQYSGWIQHPAGQDRVIAGSFTEFIHGLVQEKGKPYWKNLGDFPLAIPEP